MGVQFSVKNSKYEVSCDLEDGKSVISFKVKDRRNSNNSQHYIHYKRYKHFALPAKIKAKFKSVLEFHQYLAKHAQIITIGERDIIIDLDGDKINVPFENVNQESKIFCETQNISREIRRTQVQNSIHIVIGNQAPGQRNNNLIKNEDEKTKDRIRKVLKKIIKKNNPLRQVDLRGQNLEELVEMLEKEWDNFDKNGQVVPNMIKKKTQEITEDKKGSDQTIEKLKTEITEKTKKIQVLSIQFELYKQEWNFQKFVSEHRKTQQLTKKRTLQEFLEQISEYSRRMYVNMNTSTSSLKVQMNTKGALFSWLDNMTKELSDYRSQSMLKKRVKDPNPTDSHISSGFEDFEENKSVSSAQENLN